MSRNAEPGSPGEGDSAARDAALVERLQQGDAGAESEFVARFGARVRAMISARIRDREAVRELCNDALLTSIQALRRGQLRDPSRLCAFVHGVCRNLANNHIRTLAGRPRELPLTPEMAVADATLEVEARERSALAERAIAQLDPIDRRILTEMLTDGHSASEIALRMGVSPEVVRTRKSRAIRKIAAMLGLPSRTPAAKPPERARGGA